MRKWNHVNGRNYCKWTRKAIFLLLDKNIKFTYKEYKDEKVSNTVPQIWLNGQFIGGYEDLEKKFMDIDIDSDDIVDSDSDLSYFSDIDDNNERKLTLFQEKLLS